MDDDQDKSICFYSSVTETLKINGRLVTVIKSLHVAGEPDDAAAVHKELHRRCIVNGDTVDGEMLHRVISPIRSSNEPA